jgi:hypothetical protein
MRNSLKYLFYPARPRLVIIVAKQRLYHYHNRVVPGSPFESKERIKPAANDAAEELRYRKRQRC